MPVMAGVEQPKAGARNLVWGSDLGGKVKVVSLCLPSLRVCISRKLGMGEEPGLRRKHTRWG